MISFGRLTGIARLLPSLAESNFLPAVTATTNKRFFFPLATSVRFGSRHGGYSGYRKDFNILKDWPVGPHKTLPPNVKYDGRIGPTDVNYRHIIHYPKDGKYTIKKLRVTKLGGRDPVTGRKVIQGARGGSKQKHRWIDWRRLPEGWDPDGPDLVERVIDVRYDPMRKPWIALTGYGDTLRWQVATEGMKAGDLVTTSCKIPTNPVKPVAGNGYPLGALPVGTEICLVQWYPDTDVVKVYAERESAKIVRKAGDRVIVQRSSKHQFSLDQRCQCVVGQISIHPLKAMHIGSPNRSRWMGIAPRSGLWHRKTGIHGRKIKALPPVAVINPPKEEKEQTLRLHCSTEGIMGMPIGRKRPFDVTKW